MQLARRFKVPLLFILLASAPALAEDKGGGAGTKADIKKAHRWSLSDWLETRDRMRLMDLWLAMHSPSPYEFFVTGAYKSGTGGAGANYQGWDFAAAANAYLFGVELQRQMSNAESAWLGMVNLRLFGIYNQATNLTIQGGVRAQDSAAGPLWNPFVGAHATLYFAKAFGTTLLYRYTVANGMGVPTGSSHFEWGAFIDFQFVRVFGDYFAHSGASGFHLGARVYF